MGRRSNNPLLNREGKKIFASKGAYIIKESGAGFVIRDDLDNVPGALTAGRITASSGFVGTMKAGTSGANIVQWAIISETINFGAAGSGSHTNTIDTPVSAANSGFIASGDYIIPLSQPAESGYTILPAVAASAETVSVRVVTTAAINPADQAYKFAVLRAV